MEADKQRKIVVAIDASEQAAYAFDWYIKSIHRPTNDVVLLHVPELLDGDRNRMLYLSAAAYEEALQKEQAKIKTLEEKFNAKILEHGISGRIRSEGGNKPGEVICRVAEEEQATMVVLGTRGLGTIRRTILGSVSDFVVHHAHCPVIVCRQH